MARNIDGIQNKRIPRTPRSTEKEAPRKPIGKKEETKESVPSQIKKKKIFQKKEPPVFTPPETFYREDFSKKKRIPPLAIILPILLLVFGIGGYMLLSHFDRTEIEILPRVSVQDIDKQITLYKQPGEGELGFDIIATSHTASIDVTGTDRIPVGERASGTIVIYNKFSSEPQRLLPRTRFETPDGKIYVLGEKEVVIPGRKSKDEPGQVEAVVYAGEVGEAYNIGLTDFTIPGYKEIGSTDRYNTIYALSKTEMAGGRTGFKVVISDTDRKKAEETLRERIMRRLSQVIERQKAENVIVIPNSIAFQFGEGGVRENEGNTELVMEGVALAVLIHRQDIMKFIEAEISETERGDGISTLDYSDLDISLVSSPGADLLATLDRLTIHAAGKSIIGWHIDTDDMAYDILGLSKGALFEYVDAHPGIESFTARIYPFWREVVSEMASRVDIEVEDFPDFSK